MPLPGGEGSAGLPACLTLPAPPTDRRPACLPPPHPRAPNNSVAGNDARTHGGSNPKGKLKNRKTFDF